MQASSKKQSNQQLNQKSSEKSSEKIIEILKEDNTLTIEQLSAMLGISSRAVEKNIRKLREKGLIKRVGGRKTGYWKVEK